MNRGSARARKTSATVLQTVGRPILAAAAFQAACCALPRIFLGMDDQSRVHRMHRTARATIQESVHRHECPARQRQGLGRERPMRPKTSAGT